MKRIRAHVAEEEASFSTFLEWGGSWQEPPAARLSDSQQETGKGWGVGGVGINNTNTPLMLTHSPGECVFASCPAQNA